MSLILEALRKLERDKQAPGRSLVVTGATDWARSEPRAGQRLAWGLAALLALGLTFFAWQSRTAHAPDTRPAAPSPAARAPEVPATGAAIAPAASARREAPAAAGARQIDRAPPAATDAAGLARQAPRSPPAVSVAELDAPEPAEAAPESGDETPAATQPAPARADVELQAIAERDGRPIAIVNGRLVREGDSWGGIRILRIGRAEIEIELNGQRRTIGF